MFRRDAAYYDATDHFIARYGFIHDLRVNSIMTALFTLNCINTSSEKVNLMLYNKINFLPTLFPKVHSFSPRYAIALKRLLIVTGQNMQIFHSR